MKHSLIFALASLSAVGCSTISHGPRQTMLVESDPAGAEIIVRCGQAALSSATTPVRLTVGRKIDPCVLTFRREGYVEKEVSLERRFHWTYWGNLAPLVVAPIAFYAGTPTRTALALGFITVPLLVDWKTGARYAYPRMIHVTLEPTSEEKPAP